MLLPQTKEREYRFALALRMGLPIFALMLAFVTHTFVKNSETLEISFYIESIILLVFSIYFFLYLIYKGYSEKITDDVSKTFTREYLFQYLKKELQKEENYTLILISIDNLDDINRLYGMKNGDKVLEETASWINSYLKEKKIVNFPLGHIKGGDFILGLKGKKSEHEILLDFLCLKANEFKIDDIEISLLGAISDSNYSKDLDYIVENTFELLEAKREYKIKVNEEEINPNEMESLVINAINTRSLSMMTQDVLEDDTIFCKELFIHLKTPSGKALYAKNFIKIINKLGLSVEYDLMVLEELILKTRGEEKNLYAINISPSSLRNEKFLSTIRELLRDADCRVMFILAEKEYYSHTARYNSIIHSLKRSGVLIAIDRLGSLHTSFLYLRELDIDVVRFDTYYSHTEKIKKNSSIIDGFNTMIHQKGLKSWMKNIQDSKTLALTKELQIDYIQGKGISSLITK